MADDDAGTPETGDPHGTFGTKRGPVLAPVEEFPERTRVAALPSYVTDLAHDAAHRACGETECHIASPTGCVRYLQGVAGAAAVWFAYRRPAESDDDRVLQLGDRVTVTVLAEVVGVGGPTSREREDERVSVRVTQPTMTVPRGMVEPIPEPWEKHPPGVLQRDPDGRTWAVDGNDRLVLLVARPAEELGRMRPQTWTTATSWPVVSGPQPIPELAPPAGLELVPEPPPGAEERHVPEPPPPVPRDDRLNPNAAGELRTLVAALEHYEDVHADDWPCLAEQLSAAKAALQSLGLAAHPCPFRTCEWTYTVAADDPEGFRSDLDRHMEHTHGVRTKSLI